METQIVYSKEELEDRLAKRQDELTQIRVQLVDIEASREGDRTVLHDEEERLNYEIDELQKKIKA